MNSMNTEPSALETLHAARVKLAHARALLDHNVRFTVAGVLASGVLEALEEYDIALRAVQHPVLSAREAFGAECSAALTLQLV